MLTLAYIAAGSAWGFLCWKHREDLLPIQVRAGRLWDERQILLLCAELHLLPLRLVSN